MLRSISLKTISFKKLILENKLFFYIFAVFMVFGFAWLLIAPKGLFLVVLNRNHTEFYDFLFYYITWMGNGIFIVLASIPLMFISIRAFTFSISSFFVSGLLSQAIKYLLAFPRPYSWFAYTSNFNIVDGVDILSKHSMPSGHTATAFAFFLVLAITFKNKYLGIIFFSIALLVGISRIYLLQHFFEDVFVGAALGVLTVIILNRIFESKFIYNPSCKFDQPLIKLK